MTHTLHRLPRALLVGLLALAAHGSFAQTAPFTPAPPANDALYQQFGGQPGLVKLMDDFAIRLMADARMKPFFKDTDLKHLKEQLVIQFCEVSGGPCKRDGPDMKKVHDGFDINRGHFNALVEVLQQSMDAQGIAFSAQNRMLAQLAPMHRDIVNVR